MIHLFLIPTANQLSLFHIMNYKKIYFQIIKNRINNPLPLDELGRSYSYTYSEIHHIIPHSFGGSDNPNNLVRLTAREHFIVHFLLYKMYKHRSQVLFPNSQKEAERYRKMAYALHLMLQLSSLKKSSYTKMTGRTFEQLKKENQLLRCRFTTQQINDMFQFYVDNKITPKTIHIIQKQFNVDMEHHQFLTLFNQNGLKLTEYEFYQRNKIPLEKAKEMAIFYKENRIGKNNLYLLHEKFNVDCSIATLIWTFNTYGLSYQFANQYSDEQLKTMYNFVIEKNITSKTIDIFNEKFNTNFKYKSLISLFYKRGYKLTDSKTYVVDKNVAVKYTKKMVVEMYQFYLDNNLTVQTIDVLNQQFNTKFTHKNFQVILRKHNFHLPDKRKKYHPSEIKKWFDFYVKNKINKSNLHVFNQFFNTNFNFDMLRSTFYNHGYRLAKLETFKNPIGARTYSKQQIQQMFQFYLDNYFNKNKLDLLNKTFNTNFKQRVLNGLFNKNGYRIRDHLRLKTI